MSKFTFTVTCALLMTALGGCSSKPLPVLGEIPQFELTDQKGEKFTRTALDGHVWVADFIFTNCEGPCPRMSSRMHQLQGVTPADVKMVSFTVDPERDSPAALAEYGRKFGADDSRWSFLTGSPETLNHLDRDAFMLGTIGASLDHSTRFVLIDKKGRVRGYYGLGENDPVGHLAKDAARLLKEDA